MPTIRVYVDDDTFRRLKVEAALSGRDVDTIAGAAVYKAANQAVPCLDGRPTQENHDAIWDKVNVHT